MNDLLKALPIIAVIGVFVGAGMLVLRAAKREHNKKRT